MSAINKNLTFWDIIKQNVNLRNKLDNEIGLPHWDRYGYPLDENQKMMQQLVISCNVVLKLVEEING